MARRELMLPGVSGSLLAATFLERVLVPEFVASLSDSTTLRALHRCCRRLLRTLGPAASVRAIADVATVPLFDILGFRVVRLDPDGGGLVGTLNRSGGASIALRVASWGTDTQQQWRDAVRAGRAANTRWGLVFSGSHLRVVDAKRPWSRRSLEFDLAAMLSDERSLTALVGILQAAGTAEALEGIVSRGERHGEAVCASLGRGVLDALGELFIELDGRRSPTALTDRVVFDQAITIVYRLLFLLFAEARALVPTWHPTYRTAYTVDALCHRALEQPRRRGLWKALQAMSRLAHHGCHAGDLIVTPFNGRLFAPRHTPLATHAVLSDAVVGRAVISLATTRRDGARERIAYGDLGVEQLGAVYERVLDYEPVRDSAGPRLVRTTLERKSSGSFYTPRSVTDFLVRRALAPLIEGKSVDQLLGLRVLDPAMGSGAFLVAACRYLGDAVERALVDEGTVAADCTNDERSQVRRLVAQRCLFGVDLNPTAVQLARLSLWLASLSPERPLTFLDHHLTAGDSLVGASLLDLTREPFAARSRTAKPDHSPLFPDEASEDLARHVLPERYRIAFEPGDTTAAVRAKELALSRINAAGTPLSRWKDAANLWCAAWFWNDTKQASSSGETPLTRGVYHDTFAAITGRGGTLARQHHAALSGRVRTIADAHRFFHWELEFPEVFFAADGRRRPDAGFDAVLGNPPWDVMRADAGEGSARHQARARHGQQRRFFRESRIYHHQSDGHANRYQLFVERALQLTRPGGRVALIVPSGLATNHGSSRLRRALLGGTRIERLFGFDNRQAIFPIHRDVRFLLLTATKEPATERVVCALDRSDTSWLDQLPDAAADDPPDARRVVLSRQALEAWDPQHLTWPWFSRADDVDIVTAVAARAPAIADASGWHITFGRELNATDDRAHFQPRRDGERGGIPIIEGKHLEPFRARVSATTMVISIDAATRLLDPTRTFQRARLAYRDVASATNRLTLIAARLKAGTISTHTVFCSKDTLDPDDQYCLLALLNSLVANYLVRLRVTTHVTTAVMARLPVPRPSSDSDDYQALATLARELEGTGVDAPHAPYARLNAIAARVYGLTRPQYQHILGTFPLLPRALIRDALAAYSGGA
jgi:hypothetical protein